MDTTLNMKHSGRLPVLASVEPVVARGSRVFLHHSLVDPAINQWGNLPTLQSGWQHPCHYFDGTEETVRWIFVLDLLNHCFWPDKDEPVWTVSYRGAPYSGYWGLAAALKRAHEEGIPLTRATFLSSISFSDLEKILSGNGGKLPLLEKRYENLREAGRILTLHWQGDIVNLVRDTAGSAVRTAKALVASFPGFRDEATFEGARVYFWKRAQIFASDLHTAFSGKLWGHFNDIDQLTAFADYKLPQVLRELGIISYHPELASIIDRQEELLPGSPEEMEIRAATIMAVEALKQGFLRFGKKMTSAQIDNWLWQLGQLDSFRRFPYHRCRTIFY